MEDFVKFIPLLIPLLVIQLGVVVFCVADIAKKKKTKNLSPALWTLITIALMSSFVGPILYLIFGRAEASAADDDI